MDIIITANSPGEVATWLTPAVKALKERLPGAEITVFTPPCTFASGQEAAIIAALPEVKRTFSARQLLSFILTGRQLPDFEPSPNGVVLFLGGDLAYAALLARRLGYPAYAYTEGRVQWVNGFAGFLLPDDQARIKAIRSGAPPYKLYVVGDLMLDAIEFHWERADLYRALQLDENRTVIALFPGSRPHEFGYMLPMFLRSAEIISLDLRAVQFVLSVSPFVTEDFLEDVLVNPNPVLEGTGGEILSVDETETEEPVALSRMCAPSTLGHIWQIRTWGGLSLPAVQGWQYDIMGLAALGLTIPGSNTAEMAALGVPMVVVTPLNKPEAIPLEGIPGLVGSIPVIGPRIKRKAVLAAAKRVQYAALPNRKVQEELVPELKGELHPEDVAITVGNLMRHPEKMKGISDRLKQVMGSKGAAQMIAETLAVVLDS